MPLMTYKTTAERFILSKLYLQLELLNKVSDEIFKIYFCQDATFHIVTGELC